MYRTANYYLFSAYNFIFIAHCYIACFPQMYPLIKIYNKKYMQFIVSKNKILSGGVSKIKRPMYMYGMPNSQK